MFQTTLSDNLTPVEFKEAAIYYHKLAIGQAIQIAEYEKREINYINELFRLAKELDSVTEEAFNSPYMHKKERNV